MDEITSSTSGDRALGAAFLAFVAALVGAAVTVVVWSTPSESDGVPPPAVTTASASGSVAAASGGWDASRTPSPARSKPEAEVAAIWKRTRLAGPADLHRYDAAVTGMSDFTGVCSAVGATASEPGVAQACKRRGQVMAGTLAAARTVMGDWRAHQAAMAAHKAGDFDAAHAQTQWVAAWTAAPENLNAFKAADARLTSAQPCHS